MGITTAAATNNNNNNNKHLLQSLIISLLMTLLVLGLSSSVLDHDPIQGGSKQSKPIYDQDSLKPVMGFGDSTVVEVMKPADDGDEGTPVRCYSCRCCDKMGMCVDTNCCYGIKCHVPDKPPDMCFFLPLACNCNSCPSS